MSISINPAESLNEFIPKSDQHDFDIVNLVSEGEISDRNRENEIGREYLVQLYEKAQRIYEKNLEKAERKENMKKETEILKTVAFNEDIFVNDIRHKKQMLLFSFFLDMPSYIFSDIMNKNAMFEDNIYEKFHSYMFPGLHKDKKKKNNETQESLEQSQKKEGFQAITNIIDKKDESSIGTDEIEENKKNTQEIETIPNQIEKMEVNPTTSSPPPEIIPKKENLEEQSEKPDQQSAKPDIAEKVVKRNSSQKTPPTEESSKKNSDSNQKIDDIIGLAYLKNLYKECLTSYLHEHRSKSDSEPEKEKKKEKENEKEKEKERENKGKKEKIMPQQPSPSITSPVKKSAEPKKTISETPKATPEPKHVFQTPQNVRNNHQRAVSTNITKPKTVEHSQERKFQIKTYRRPSPITTNLSKNDKNEIHSKPNDRTTAKSIPKANISVQIEEINTEKRKIEDKIKDLDTKISNVQPPSSLLKTEKTLAVKNHEQKNLENQVFVKKMQSMKVDMQMKRLKDKQEKQESLMKDIDKLNKEKEKIVEVFKLEKEKTFWQKMQQIEERKADRLIKMTPIDKKKNKSEFLPQLHQNGDSEGVKTPLREPKINSATPKTDVRSTTPRRMIGIKNTPTSLNKPNYIADLRKQNCELEKNGVKLKKDCHNWERYLKDSNMNKNEKYDSVLNRAQIMENQAKMKEKVAMVAGADFETEDEINNLYAESIKAKLALLENLKN